MGNICRKFLPHIGIADNVLMLRTYRCHIRLKLLIYMIHARSLQILGKLLDRLNDTFRQCVGQDHTCRKQKNTENNKPWHSA